MFIFFQNLTEFSSQFSLFKSKSWKSHIYVWLNDVQNFSAFIITPHFFAHEIPTPQKTSQIMCHILTKIGWFQTNCIIPPPYILNKITFLNDIYFSFSISKCKNISRFQNAQRARFERCLSSFFRFSITNLKFKISSNFEKALKAIFNEISTWK